MMEHDSRIDILKHVIEICDVHAIRRSQVFSLEIETMEEMESFSLLHDDRVLIKE
jgi:hypothetical protein